MTQIATIDSTLDYVPQGYIYLLFLYAGHLGNELSSGNQTDNAECNKPSCGTTKNSTQSNQNDLTQQPSCNINKVAGVKSMSNVKAPVELPNFEHLEPVGEPWYVGKMSRSQAENLLRYDGDFLVRASIQQPGQFVLSGLQDGKYRHLLLADPNGKVIFCLRQLH